VLKLGYKGAGAPGGDGGPDNDGSPPDDEDPVYVENLRGLRELLGLMGAGKDIKVCEVVKRWIVYEAWGLRTYRLLMAGDGDSRRMRAGSSLGHSIGQLAVNICCLGDVPVPDGVATFGILSSSPQPLMTCLPAPALTCLPSLPQALPSEVSLLSEVKWKEVAATPTFRGWLSIGTSFKVQVSGGMETLEGF
jgi:hypothetical protein